MRGAERLALGHGRGGDEGSVRTVRRVEGEVGEGLTSKGITPQSRPASTPPTTTRCASYIVLSCSCSTTWPCTDSRPPNRRLLRTHRRAPPHGQHHHHQRPRAVLRELESRTAQTEVIQHIRRDVCPSAQLVEQLMATAAGRDQAPTLRTATANAEAARAKDPQILSPRAETRRRSPKE